MNKGMQPTEPEPATDGPDSAAKTLGDAKEIFFISIIVVIGHKYGEEPKSGNYNLDTLLVIALDILINVHVRAHFNDNPK